MRINFFVIINFSAFESNDTAIILYRYTPEARFVPLNSAV
jgi:hypothetical protein